MFVWSDVVWLELVFVDPCLRNSLFLHTFSVGLPDVMLCPWCVCCGSLSAHSDEHRWFLDLPWGHWWNHVVDGNSSPWGGEDFILFLSLAMPFLLLFLLLIYFVFLRTEKKVWNFDGQRSFGRGYCGSSYSACYRVWSKVIFLLILHEYCIVVFPMNIILLCSCDCEPVIFALPWSAFIFIFFAVLFNIWVHYLANCYTDTLLQTCRLIYQ